MTLTLRRFGFAVGTGILVSAATNLLLPINYAVTCANPWSFVFNGFIINNILLFGLPITIPGIVGASLGWAFRRNALLVSGIILIEALGIESALFYHSHGLSQCTLDL